jgi:surface antigen
MGSLDKQVRACIAAILIVSATMGSATAQMRYLQPEKFSLSKEDAQYQRNAALGLLDTDPPQIGQSSEWKNPRSGAHGTVTMLQASQKRGLPCRTMRYVVDASRVAESMDLTVTLCKTSTGAWKALD